MWHIVSTGLILDSIFIITAISMQGKTGWSDKRSSMHLGPMNSQEAKGIGKGMQNNEGNFSYNRSGCQHIKLNTEEMGQGKCS